MGKKSKISWTDATWNPWRGCRKVSAGCANCYMFRQQRRFGDDPTVVMRSKTTFNDPLKWAEPQRIFVCSWSDFFIEDADEWRDEAWAIMRAAPQHTYMLLTKRLEPIAERLPDDWGNGYPNVWLGASVENQRVADERIPLLLQLPAAVRFLSCEPLLGAVDLNEYIKLTADNSTDEHFEREHWGYDDWSGGFMCRATTGDDSCYDPQEGIHWVIAGGESGPGYRPMGMAWARSLRDQCQEGGVPFFFKQQAAYRSEQAPYIVEEDGRHTEYQQMPDLVIPAEEIKQ
jgi:protein gp37